jgi:hypothetical protein
MDTEFIFDKLPEELLHYWADVSVAAIQRSDVRVVITLGRAAINLYE